MEQSFSNTDLERRRASSRRIGWIIAAVALLIYIAGLFIKR
ncbi:MAG: hypothetical protein WBJ68_06665 [Candidatus Dechloromonas phosphoritropha]|jgi:hypothetical protein